MAAAFGGLFGRLAPLLFLLLFLFFLLLLGALLFLLGALALALLFEQAPRILHARHVRRGQRLDVCLEAPTFLQPLGLFLLRAPRRFRRGFLVGGRVDRCARGVGGRLGRTERAIVVFGIVGRGAATRLVKAVGREVPAPATAATQNALHVLDVNRPRLARAALGVPLPIHFQLHLVLVQIATIALTDVFHGQRDLAVVQRNDLDKDCLADGQDLVNLLHPRARYLRNVHESVLSKPSNLDKGAKRFDFRHRSGMDRVELGQWLLLLLLVTARIVIAALVVLLLLTALKIGFVVRSRISRLDLARAFGMHKTGRRRGGGGRRGRG